MCRRCLVLVLVRMLVTPPMFSRRHCLIAAVCASLTAPLAVRAGAYDDFFHAMELDDAPSVSMLLARGFDANTADESGQLGLYLALRLGADKVVAVLVAHPSTQLDRANAAGETPLMMAALRGRLPWMKALLDKGCRVNIDGWSPLHYAASSTHEEAVTMLVQRGARIDARSPNGTTALMMAARYGQEGSVDVLLRSGADPRVRNDRDLSAADFARLGGREPLAQRLALVAR